MRAALAVILLTIVTQAGAAEYKCEVTKKLEHFHFMLLHSLRLRGSSSIGLG